MIELNRIKHTKYKTKSKVFENLGVSGILGLEFLSTNEYDLDLKNHNLKIDNLEVDFEEKETKEIKSWLLNPDKEVISKSKIYKTKEILKVYEQIPINEVISENIENEINLVNNQNIKLNETKLKVI